MLPGDQAERQEQGDVRLVDHHAEKEPGQCRPAGERYQAAGDQRRAQGAVLAGEQVLHDARENDHKRRRDEMRRRLAHRQDERAGGDDQPGPERRDEREEGQRRDDEKIGRRVGPGIDAGIGAEQGDFQRMQLGDVVDAGGGAGGGLLGGGIEGDEIRPRPVADEVQETGAGDQEVVFDADDQIGDGAAETKRHQQGPRRPNEEPGPGRWPLLVRCTVGCR